MIRFGVCQNFDNGKDWDRFLAWERGEGVGVQPHSDFDLYQDDLYLSGLAEPLGFDSLFCIEHHVAPYAMTPNPLQLLSYWAGRTSRIALGTMVIVLPWYKNPFRVAEEIAVLSNMLGPDRRLLISVGRGLSPREYAAMGIEMKEARGRYLEAIDLVKHALLSSDFSWDGEYFKLPRVELRPKPVNAEAIVANMSFAAGSPDTAALVGAKGLRPIIIPTKSLEAHGHDVYTANQKRAEAHGLPPARSIVAPWIFCAETEAEAKRGAMKHFEEMGRGSFYNYQFDVDKRSIPGYESYTPTSSGGDYASSYRDDKLETHVWGTPEMCIERIAKLSEQFGADEFVGEFKYGEMDRSIGEANMTLFAEQVLPELKKMEPTPLDKATLVNGAFDNENSRSRSFGIVAT